MKQNGFTLIELSVAISIFAVIVVLAVDITLGIGEAQRKATNLQAVLDNVRFGLELMTREMRTGTEFKLVTQCGSAGDGIEFVNENVGSGQRRFYYLGGEQIMRIAMSNRSPIDPSADCPKAVPFSADEVSVTQFKILLEGEVVDTGVLPENRDGQPRITISLKVASKDPKTKLNSAMNLQTTVVQRLRDL